MAATNLQATIQQIRSPENIAEIARAMGVDEATARRAVDAALPALIAGMGKNASTDEGASSLSKALEVHVNSGVADDVGGYMRSGGNVDEGRKIVTHVLGDRSSEIETGLGRGVGINGQQMGSLLAALAPLVLGALGKDQHQSGGGSGGLAGALLGPNSPILDMMGASSDSPAASIAGLLGGLLGSGTGSSQSSDMGSLLGGLLGGSSASSGASSGGDAMAGMLGSLLGGGQGGSSSGGDPLMGMLGSLLGGGSQSSGAAQPDIGSLLGGLMGAGGSGSTPAAPPQGGTDLDSLMGSLLGGKPN